MSCSLLSALAFVSIMQRDVGSSNQSEVSGRIRHRKRSNEVLFATFSPFPFDKYFEGDKYVDQFINFSLFVILLIFIQGAPEVSKGNGTHLLVNDRNKYKSMLIRTHSSIWMIGGFVFVIYMGHLYIWAMIVVVQIFMAKELFNLLRKANEDRDLPWFRALNWYSLICFILYS